MEKRFFLTNNYYAVVRSVDALKNRDPSLPGMGLVYGRWGLGKTETIDYFYGESNIYYVRALRAWSPRDLLKGICDEYKVHAEHRTVDRFEQICKEVSRRGEPLFIDEADYLFKNSMALDLLRDIHDVTRVPVIIVGMEEMCGKLQKFGQLWSRILPAGIVEFQPLSPPEMILITKKWCKIEMLPEAAELLCRYTEGDFRYIVGYLLELEKACAVNKVEKISMPMTESLVKKMSKKKDISSQFDRNNIKRLRVTGRQPA